MGLKVREGEEMHRVGHVIKGLVRAIYDDKKILRGYLEDGIPKMILS